MSEPKSEPRKVSLKLHGIQLNYVGVRELHFDSDRLPSTVKADEFEDHSFTTGHSRYDETRKTIAVTAKLESKNKTDNVHLRVELSSEFRVDENVFPKDRVEEWAAKAAFYVIFPYLREHVHSLCTRTGLPAIMLPLIEIPSFKITSSAAPEIEQHPQEASAANS